MSGLAQHLVQLVGIAKNWAMKNLPGWSDDSHRDLLALHGARRRGDKISALTMTAPQLASVLDDYAKRGWPRVKKVFKKEDGKAVGTPPDIAHLVRLWGRLGDAGKIEQATRPALLAWCARQLGSEVTSLDDLAPADRQSLIEGLKGWLGR